MKNKTNPFMLAVSMLTRIPVKSGDVDESSWKWAAASFPVCGFIIGTVCIIPAVLLPSANIAAGKYISGFTALHDSAVNLICALLFVILSAWMTRCFHLDGFCDACDAFSAVTDSPEKRLEIMKDPHPGAVAVCALILLLVGKIILVFLILQKFTGFGIRPFLLHSLPTLISIPVFARFAIMLLAFIGKYPRKEGTGKTIIENTSMGSIITGLITIAPLCVFTFLLHAIGAAFLMSFLTVFYWKQKSEKLLGGITGDILGACCETAELTVALTLLFLI